MRSLPVDRSYALQRDADDPLAGFRGRFAIDDPSLIYLDGNSLGMLPLATAERIADVVRREWGTGLVRSWAHWIGLPSRAGDLLGSGLLGAGRTRRLRGRPCGRLQLQVPERRAGRARLPLRERAPA